MVRVGALSRLGDIDRIRPKVLLVTRY